MSPAALVRRFPLVSYFVLAYAVSAVALAVLGPPSLAPGGRRNLASLVMFPVMVVAVGLIGVALTGVVEGRRGLRELGSRWRWRVGLRWYAAAVLIPPAAILLVLTVLRLLLSPAFAPGFDLFGIAAGAVAGFCEEWGWTGFAYPRMAVRLGPLGGAVVLGVLWGIWHLPVVDSLGAASPHGPAWPEFFLAFVALVAGLRVLIAWVYIGTGSVLLAQVMHASSTGFLVILSAGGVSPYQESAWYALDAAVLWMVVVLVVLGGGFQRAAVVERRSADA